MVGASGRGRDRFFWNTSRGKPHFKFEKRPLWLRCVHYEYAAGMLWVGWESAVGVCRAYAMGILWICCGCSMVRPGAGWYNLRLPPVAGHELESKSASTTRGTWATWCYLVLLPGATWCNLRLPWAPWRFRVLPGAPASDGKSHNSKLGLPDYSCESWTKTLHCKLTGPGRQELGGRPCTAAGICVIFHTYRLDARMSETDSPIINSTSYLTAALQCVGGGFYHNPARTP